MSTDQFNKSVTDSIKNLVAHNKAQQGKLPTSFSEWLEQNGDSIEIGEDHGGNVILDRIAANHDIYKNGNPFQ